MKKRTNNWIYFSLLATGLMFFTAGCKKDKTPDRDKFLGAYTVVETCGSGNDAYDITILESGTADNAIIIANLYDSATQLSATVSGNNLTIASQLTSAVTWSGNGSINGNTLSINFALAAAGVSDNCTAVCSRK